MSNCQKCNVQNELSDDENFSDEIEIWTESDILMPKNYYSLCEHCYKEENV